MDNEFKAIKDRILQEEKIEELLIHMGCEHVAHKGNRYEAQLPSKFDSDSRRSVQVKITESMGCSVRSRSVSNIDIFGLVSFIVFDIYSEDEQQRNLPKAKRWICEKLGYSEFLNSNHQPQKQQDDPLKWLKDVQKKRSKKRMNNTYENKILPDDILNQYVMYPYLPYIEEGIGYHTQVQYQIGFDIYSERIIYPIHNAFGDIVSVKGRTTDPLYRTKGIYKFLYYYNFNKMIELYNWCYSIEHIINKKEIIIFEGEKSCWLATQFNFPNCVAIGGDDLSDYQVSMIKALGIDLRIILALDKDKSADDFKRQARKFGNARQVYALWDGETKLLSQDFKHSPVDLGAAVFEQLYKNCFKYRILS